MQCCATASNLNEAVHFIVIVILTKWLFVGLVKEKQRDSFQVEFREREKVDEREGKSETTRN